MTNWKETKFKDFITLQRGYDLFKNEYREGMFPVVGATEIAGFHDKFKVLGPGITVGRVGSIGNVQYIQENFWPHQDCLYVKDFKGNDVLYVYYLLIALPLSHLDAGGAVPALNRNHLGNIKIDLPPIKTQQRIASILSAYDELIEVNSQRIKLLEETARESYKEWFVRLRFPGYKQAKFVKGIPEDWEVKKVDHIAEVTSSKRIFLSDYVSEGIPFYRGKEISLKSKNETLNDLLYISVPKFKEIQRKFGAPKAGDILITAVGTIGNIYLVNDSDGDFYFKDGNLIWLRGYESQELSFYFYFYSISEVFTNALSSITIGSSQEALTISSLKKISLLLPTVALIKKFYQIAYPIKSQIDILQQQNTHLRQIRDRLLPRLISGKLQVKSLTTNAGKDCAHN